MYNSTASTGNAYVQSPVPLPPGWQAAVTAEGQQYFINHNDRTTHWTLPQQPAMPSALPQYGAVAATPYGGAPQPAGGYHQASGASGFAQGYGGAYSSGNGGGHGRPRRGIDRSKMKTKMCMNMANGGTCSYGANCAFAHSSEELAAQPHFNNAAGRNGRSPISPQQQQGTAGAQ